MITISVTQLILFLLAAVAAGHLLTLFPLRHYYRNLTDRNKDLRRQIGVLLKGHHMDEDQYRDIERKLAEHAAMCKEYMQIGLYFRDHYSEAQREMWKGKTTAEIVIERLRAGAEGGLQ